MENEKLVVDFDDPEAIPGVIQKVANVKLLEITGSDLKKINQFTLEPLGADDVFVFKASICDNEQDDRNFMPFDLSALKDLKKLYIGKTMIKDHMRRADNQVARVYDTELIQKGKVTGLGEVHSELVAKIYMVKTDSNKDLIAEIKAGIKKEVSTHSIPKKMVCNICGADNMKDYCRHWPGVEYEQTQKDGKMAKTTCKMLLSGAKEAYELSFVAVPAQPRAGTQKSIGFSKPVKGKGNELEQENLNINTKKDAELDLNIKLTESFLYVQKESEDKWQ